MTTITTRPTGPVREAPRVRRAWRRDETELAVRLIASGYSVDETAVRLGRTADGVRWLFSRTLNLRPEKIRAVEPEKTNGPKEYDVPLFDLRVS